MGSYLSDLATRKMRIKSISEQRLLSTKNKEIKQLEDKMMEEYEVAVRELKARYIEN